MPIVPWHGAPRFRGPPRRQKNLDRGGPTGRGQGFIYPLSGVASKKKKSSPPVTRENTLVGATAILWHGAPQCLNPGLNIVYGGTINLIARIEPYTIHVIVKDVATAAFKK
jgi:hypothetical protein